MINADLFKYKTVEINKPSEKTFIIVDVDGVLLCCKERAKRLPKQWVTNECFNGFMEGYQKSPLLHKNIEMISSFINRCIDQIGYDGVDVTFLTSAYFNKSEDEEYLLEVINTYFNGLSNRLVSRHFLNELPPAEYKKEWWKEFSESNEVDWYNSALIAFDDSPANKKMFESQGFSVPDLLEGVYGAE
ncbi:MAG: hypothetical protein HRU12_20565 [Phaeodactylibacter sp.]|nr:hypothetical protein [Phaeodactylibacter sp.]